MTFTESDIMIVNLQRFCKSMHLGHRISELTLQKIKKRYKNDNPIITSELSKITIQLATYSSNKNNKKIYLNHIYDSFSRIYKEIHLNKISLKQTELVCSLISVVGNTFEQDLLKFRVDFHTLTSSNLHILNQLFSLEDENATILQKTLERKLNDKHIYVEDGPYFKKILNKDKHTIFVLFM